MKVFHMEMLGAHEYVNSEASSVSKANQIAVRAD